MPTERPVSEMDTDFAPTPTPNENGNKAQSTQNKNNTAFPTTANTTTENGHLRRISHANLTV